MDVIGHARKMRNDAWTIALVRLRLLLHALLFRRWRLRRLCICEESVTRLAQSGIDSPTSHVHTNPGSWTPRLAEDYAREFGREPVFKQIPSSQQCRNSNFFRKSAIAIL